MKHSFTALPQLLCLLESWSSSLIMPSLCWTTALRAQRTRNKHGNKQGPYWRARSWPSSLMQFYLIVQPESMWKAVQHTTVISISLIMAMFDPISIYFTSLLAFFTSPSPWWSCNDSMYRRIIGVSLPHLIARKHTSVKSRQLKSKPKRSCFHLFSWACNLQLATLFCFQLSCLMAMRLLASYGCKVQNKVPRMENESWDLLQFAEGHNKQ